MPPKKRRVLYLLPTLGGGGAERVVVTLLCNFDRARFEGVLAVVDMREAVYREELPSDVRVIDLACSRVRYAMPKIIQLIRTIRPDVVFSTLGHLNLSLAIMRPLLPDGPRYCARETSIVSHANAMYRLPYMWNWAYKRFYKRFDVVICQSLAMRDDLVLKHRFPAHKAIIISNPVDRYSVRALAELGPDDEPATPRPADGKLRLLTVGRFSWAKGLDLLVEALSLCQRSDIQLTIVGDGPLRAEIEALARSRGVQDQIVFAGFQTNPYPFYARADAMVVSSRYEGFPNVVLEALACGLPVISTPAPGVAELVGSVPGCELAGEVSAASLAESLARFRLGRKIHAEALEPYEVASIMKRYEAVFS